MALAPRISAAIANLMMDAGLGARANNGYIRIYTGAKPANIGDAPGGTLLAELRLAADAFPAAAGGVLTGAAVTGDGSADNTGVPGWFRILESDGATVIYDGTAGAAGCDWNLNGLVGGQIIAGGTVDVSSLTLTLPLS